MSWVDVNDTTGVITVDYGQAGRDIVDAPSNAVDSVANTVSGAVDTVTAPVTNFIDRGQAEGYGEAIWQDVIQSPSDIPGAARGAIIGSAGALAKDILDPRPGVNPMNIVGGGLAGAAVGVAAPYAVDAIQALSNPNSILRGETYSKALEGAGIASGITGEVDQGIQDMVQPGFGEEFTERGLNIAKNVTEGVGNAYQGALAGADQLGSDVAGFFGFEDVSEMYQVLADNRRNAVDKNSAVGAVAQEAMYDAGMGGALGKGAEVLGAVGKGVGRWANSNVINRGSQAIDDLMGVATKKVNPNYKGTITAGGAPSSLTPIKDQAIDLASDYGKKIMNEKGMFPGVQALADLTGKFSPKTQQFIEKNWDDMAAYVFGGKDASLRAYGKMMKDLKARGYSVPEASAELKRITGNPKVLEPIKKALLDRTSPGLAKLLGTTTAITADVED